jgi:hypothetical protein
VEALQAALAGSAPAAASVWTAVRACRGENLSGARAVVFEEDRFAFDFERLKFTASPAAAVLGPLPAYGR